MCFNIAHFVVLNNWLLYSLMTISPIHLVHILSIKLDGAINCEFPQNSRAQRKAALIEVTKLALHALLLVQFRIYYSFKHVNLKNVQFMHHVVHSNTTDYNSN
ncbi:hypothetical protein T11_17887 [Trichinella zimbabwensis]|uniref:Uncharacterized protein n=1 Tax=Trichinella zimbabwensis TaxID=268475 RepID=A0A0V1I590_9BILA|nr:hypothetical protein T11_17887 [Trichinella zimbabwensis]